MNVWKKLNTRWDSDELSSFSTIFKMLYLLFPFVVYYLSGDIVEIILWALINALGSKGSDAILLFLTEYSGTIRGIIYAMGLLTAMVILRKSAFSEITYVPNGKEKVSIKWQKIVIVILSSLIISIVLNYIFYLTGFTQSSNTYKEVYNSEFSIDFISGIILYGIFSPLAEEILIRGIVYNRLKRIFPTLLSMLLSAVLFAVFHGNLVQGVYAFLMGMLIVYFYEKNEHFIYPLISHMVANIGVYVLSYTLWK